MGGLVRQAAAAQVQRLQMLERGRCEQRLRAREARAAIVQHQRRQVLQAYRRGDGLDPGDVDGVTLQVEVP